MCKMRVKGVHYLELFVSVYLSCLSATSQCSLCIATEILGEGSSDSGAESSDEEDEEDSEGDYIIV